MNVISANYRLTRLKPSSSARLERWALALREAQIERGTKPVLDDSDLQAHVRRRFESEWRRDGAPADALIAISTMLGVESVEYRLAQADLRAFLKNEDARAWSDTLTSAWEEDYVSLSAAVWWIATGGEPGDCDDEVLESAVKTLLHQVRSKDCPLSVKGRRSSVSSRESVPRDDLSDAMPFFGMDEHKFFSGVPCVQWNSMLENGRTDVIQDNSGARAWCDLSIERDDLLSLLPKMQVEATPPTEIPVTIGAASTAVSDQMMLAANHQAPSEKISSTSTVSNASPKKQRLSPKVDPIARELKRLYPDGRPPLSNPELQHALMKEGIIDKFVAKNTMSVAVKLAWPHSENE